jgi:hypothetical protein
MDRLSAIRELLLRKSSDEHVNLLVKKLSDDMLGDILVESLEKMALKREGSDSAKATTNELVHKFVKEHDPQDRELLRDAIGHHAARYGAALKAGNKSVANRHAKQWVALNDFARKAQAIAPGVLGWEPPADINPWQASLGDTWKQGKGKDIPGWKYHHNRTNHNHDYTHLAEAPSPHLAATETGQSKYLNGLAATEHEGPNGEKRHHSGPYPMEHTKVGGKYVTIGDQDTSDLGVYKPAFFDSHPIMSHFTIPPATLGANPNIAENYHSALESYENNKLHPHVQERVKSLFEPGHGAKPEFDSVHGPDVPRYDVAGALAARDAKRGKTAPAARPEPKQEKYEHLSPEELKDLLGEAAPAPASAAKPVSKPAPAAEDKYEHISPDELKEILGD